MAHINYAPQVSRRFADNLENVMPLSMGACNFAAFGGTLEQRIRTAVQAAARYCGRCGIVVLINAPATGTDPLETAMVQLPRALPEDNCAGRAVTVRRMTNYSYDPLYGLDEETIERLLLPDYTAGSNQDNPLSAGLRAYLKIMRYRFERDPSAFGDYPFNLNLLRELAAMPDEILQRSVINYLPTELAQEVRPILTKSDIPANVFSVVDRFGTMMRKYLWTPGRFGDHSCISITQAVRDRQIICLRVPDSAGDLMRYVEAELSNLTARGVPYLLIGSSLKLSNCAALQDRFLSEHPQQNYYTGILAESIFNAAETDILQNNLIGHHDQILVFQCSGTAQAIPFSNNLGGYKHRQTTSSHAAHRRAFHILPTFTRGTQVAVTDERNIRPEELTQIPRGVLLCGRLYPKPRLIRNFHMDGGVNHGILL